MPLDSVCAVGDGSASFATDFLLALPALCGVGFALGAARGPNVPCTNLSPQALHNVELPLGPLRQILEPT
jgi:hypothetical protein